MVFGSIKNTNKNKNKKPIKSNIISHKIMFISHNTGKTKLFHFPIFIIYLVGSLFCFLLAFSIIMSTKFFYAKLAINELEKINNQNLGISSEVEALSKKINMIQTKLSHATYYSQKIKTMTTPSDSRKELAYIKNTQNTNSQPSKENSNLEPVISLDSEKTTPKKIHGLKIEQLELKSLFELVEESEFRTADQLNELKVFLAQAQKYVLKIKNLPDVAPVRGRLSSTYGWRVSPTSGQNRMHYGVDIAAPMGSPIYATANGYVTKVTNSVDYGKYLEITHDKKITTRYAHTFDVYVKEGTMVNKGDIIGAVGNSGHSTGPHVHYEIEVNGKKTDPENFIALW